MFEFLRREKGSVSWKREGKCEEDIAPRSTLFLCYCLDFKYFFVVYVIILIKTSTTLVHFIFFPLTSTQYLRKKIKFTSKIILASQKARQARGAIVSCLIKYLIVIMIWIVFQVSTTKDSLSFLLVDRLNPFKLELKYKRWWHILQMGSSLGPISRLLRSLLNICVIDNSEKGAKCPLII